MSAGGAPGPGRGFRPALTVSREAGARATPICEQLADYLSAEDESAEFGWTVFDKQLLTRVINANWLAGLEGEEEQATCGAFELTSRAIRRLALLGNTIIIGLGAVYFTADLDNVFHVRLVGSERDRIATARRSLDLGTSEAADYLWHTDQERRDFALSYFREDIGNPLSYHAVINTDGIEDDVLARMIGDLFMGWAVAKAEAERKIVSFS